MEGEALFLLWCGVSVGGPRLEGIPPLILNTRTALRPPQCFAYHTFGGGGICGHGGRSVHRGDRAPFRSVWAGLAAFAAFGPFHPDTGSDDDDR